MLDNSIDHSRRNFLRGGLSARKLTPVPDVPHLPWLNMSVFYDSCSRCGDCLTACPEKIITTGDGGFPMIDFNKGECTFCGECAESCSEKLFRQTDQPAWNASAVFSEACLARQGINCDSCRDNCEHGAILFRPRLGGCPTPELISEKCTGCGACVAPCPVNALEICLTNNQEADQALNKGLGESHGN